MINTEEFRDIQPFFFTEEEWREFENLHSRPVHHKKTKIDPVNTVVIYPPTIDWHWMKQRPQHLMMQFARHGFEVMYCNKTQSDQKDEEISPNLTLIQNNRRLIKEILPTLKRNGKQILLWVSWSKLYPFIDQYSPDFIIYDYLDDIPEWDPYLESMAAKSCLIVASAKILEDKITAKFPGKPYLFVPNGCKLSDFQKRSIPPPKRPKELRNIDGPILGFIGAWAHWVDTALMEKVASAFPEATICIIGVEYAAEVDLTIPNYLYLGYKDYKKLPRYLAHFDVCLLPFKLNSITLAADPIKIYEYLASGKPVVTTDLPELRRNPFVKIGTDTESFIRHIDEILTVKKPLNRKEVNRWLKKNTWKARYKTIENKLLDL
ncbi:glycosyltransferase [Bacillus sp. B-jedd]|uniref:glycosyltransferase n=1 Tax=Bacillus sp. B-jedd TaxID=1476857 RepID=UPI0005156A99|nr:glycosyltransferase [Bacillus sp. B-jedd]CEG25513.1 Glycosyltransferase [Bacillus sp. B-jedd]